jgi:hypothetical protein
MRLANGVSGDLRWLVERLASVGSSNPRPTLDPALREELTACFRDEAGALRATCGQRFAGWSV